MRIEVKGVEFSNKGAELMLLSIKAALDAHFDEYELVLTPGHLLPYPARAKLAAWQKFSFKQFGIDWTWLGNILPGSIRRLLRHFGIVVEKDIDVVLDASGFAYSDNWDAPRIAMTLKHINRLKPDCRYVFLSQAFGPFTNPKSKAMMKTLVERAALVVARDEASYASLCGLVSDHKIVNYPDFTPGLSVADVPLPQGLPSDYCCIVPNSKMYPKNDEAKRQTYLSFLAQAVMVAQALGLFVVLLNHEGEKDRRLCEMLLRQLTIKPMFFDGLGALEVKRLLGASTLNVSSRYHGCISGLSQGVPTLATSWSHKYEALYHFYQCEDHIIAVDCPTGELEQKMTALLDEREQWAQKLLAISAEHVALSDKMWSEVFAKLR